MKISVVNLYFEESEGSKNISCFAFEKFNFSRKLKKHVLNFIIYLKHLYFEEIARTN